MELDGLTKQGANIDVWNGQIFAVFTRLKSKSAFHFVLNETYNLLGKGQRLLNHSIYSFVSNTSVIVFKEYEMKCD